MRSSDAWLVVAFVVAAVLSRKRGSGIAWGAGWTWPVPPALYPDGTRYEPVVSQEWRASTPGHLGVDVMYARRVIGDRGELAPGSDNGTAKFFTPPGTPIVAARDGKVWSVDKSPRGWEVVLDHGKPFATYYQHLASVLVAPGQPIKAGEQLGTMGADPTDPEGLRHLHFAVWYRGAGDSASVDPEESMSSWSKAPAWAVPA